MAIGDAATAAGMDLVLGTAPANTLDTEVNKTRDYIAERTNAVTPVEKGGTGATTPAAARAALGVPSVADLSTKLTKTQTEYANDFAYRDTLITAADNNANGRLPYGGGTLSGPLYLASAAAVTNGYIALYRNSDGRVGVSPSAARFKKNIRDRAYTLDQLLRIRVVSYQLRADMFDRDDPLRADAPVDVGVIAEELIEAGLSEFVVFQDDGQALSVHYERLALVAIGALQDLAHQLDGIAERLDRLENR